MKNYIPLIALSFFSLITYGQCRLIPDKNSPEVNIKETSRDIIFEIKKSEGKYICGISMIKFVVNAANDTSYAIGLTIISPAKSRLLLNKLILTGENSTELLLNDVEGEAETSSVSNGTLYSTIKYVVYLKDDEYNSLKSLGFRSIGILDPRRKDQSVTAKILYKNILIDQINCLNR